MATRKTRPAARPFSFASFVQTLDGKPTKRSRVNHVRRFEEQVGHALSKDMARLVPKLATIAKANRVGEAFFFPARDWPVFVGRPERWAPALFTKELFTLIGLFTDTVCLASDGCGDLYFVALGAKHSEVYLYAHETMELGFLADSVASFAHAQQLAQRAADVARAQKRHLDDLKARDFARPPLAELRKELRALRSVHVPTAEFSSDIGGALEIVAGRPIRAKASGHIKRLYERAEWLISLLFHNDVYDLKSVQRRNLKRDLADPELGKLAATKLYWLWHLYVFARDAELERLARRVARDKSTLVRSTATLLVRMIRPGKVPQALLRLRAARERVQQELAGASPEQQTEFVRAQNAHRAWVEAFFEAEKRDRKVFAGMIAWLTAQLAGERVFPPQEADLTRFIALVRQQQDLARSHFEALFDLAAAWDEHERLDLALELYRAILEVPLPRSGEKRFMWLQVSNNACCIAFKLKQLELARQLFENAEHAAPENPYLYHAGACAYVALSQLERAEACVRNAVKHEYEHLDVLKTDSELAPILARPNIKTLLALT